MKVKEIVHKIRENGKDSITKNNVLFGEITLYKQPDIKLQMTVVQNLLDKGVNVEVINAPVGLIKLDEEEYTVAMVSRKYEDIDDLLNYLENNNAETVIFYMWVILDRLEECDTGGLVRLACLDKKCKLKESSRA